MIRFALTLEGVLRAEGGEKVIGHGAALFAGLQVEACVAVISAVYPEHEAARWLHVENFRGHTHLMCRIATDPAPSPACYVRQVQRLRHTGCPIDVLVTADPGAAALALSKGITTVTFCEPAYTVPEHRPDYDGTVRPWSALTAELHRQRELKAGDRRLSDDPH
ncbi:hypothetical protein [Actinomadura atramentaria]|uniref:hypothetical protein n=1 Tax=Actinomadura atramentaria TaxID=1990 RepID=UPI0003A18B2B|nr:hypothetical protein [Actinomadura atramentaria]